MQLEQRAVGRQRLICGGRVGGPVDPAGAAEVRRGPEVLSDPVQPLAALLPKAPKTVGGLRQAVLDAEQVTCQAGARELTVMMMTLEGTTEKERSGALPCNWRFPRPGEHDQSMQCGRGGQAQMGARAVPPPSSLTLLVRLHFNDRLASPPTGCPGSSCLNGLALLGGCLSELASADG